MKTQKRNKEYERMQCLRDIQKNILGHLYESINKTLEESMTKIAYVNMELNKTTHPIFFFRGMYWPRIQSRNAKRRSQCLLHPSLCTEVQDIWDKFTQDRDQTKNGIEIMLGNLLSIAGHKEDLLRLFPDALQHFVSSVSQDIFNIKEPLSDKEIQEYQEKNKNNLRHLKKLLMTQLLLNKTK